MEILQAADFEAYDAFVEAHPRGHFMQTRAWGRVKSAWNWQAVISRDENGAINGSLAVLVRKLPLVPYTMMYAPRGPVCDIYNQRVLAELTEGLKTLAKKHRACVFKTDPDVASSDTTFVELMQGLGYRLNGESKNFEGIQPRYVFRLPIQGRTPEELAAAYHSKTRYNIRVAQKNGVQVRVCGEEMLDDFYRIMLETGVRDHFITRPKAYFASMMRYLGQDCRLYMAFAEERPIAGTLAIRYGDKVWYLYGASSNAERNKMPNYLLQHEMITWASETGCALYDFRGVSGDLSEDNPLYGLYRFKKGFSGEFTEFVGELELCFHPVIYKAAMLGKKVFSKLAGVKYRLKNRKYKKGASPAAKG